MRQMAEVVHLEMQDAKKAFAGAEGYIPGYRLLDGVHGALEVGMQDKQQAPCMYDVYGVEIYDGEEYYVGNEGTVAPPPLKEDFNPDNEVIADIVKHVGTRRIMEGIGYIRKTFSAGADGF